MAANQEDALVGRRPGFFAVLSNVEHPDFGPDVYFPKYLMAVHHLQVGAELLAAEFNAIDDENESDGNKKGCGVQFIEGEQFGVVQPGNSLFEVHCRGVDDGLTMDIGDPRTAGICVFRTLNDAQVFRNKVLGAESTRAIPRLAERVVIQEFVCHE